MKNTTLTFFMLLQLLLHSVPIFFPLLVIAFKPGNHSDPFQAGWLLFGLLEDKVTTKSSSASLMTNLISRL